ncbi:hypothetical protein G8E10_09410 [Rhizobiaceae bacterium CRRU44]|uniref:Uncharacterized protein n=1 Tax=Ferranicluibacter rubi TaxID=2715133 RepID=A0AA43ZEZ6_9HYPH|nr:hypothetical protein [Ferranicluibacter rubi]NHT75896.1 hypothetical protein [Ferranicluibacter rubi]NHT75956.1 hypothetical protein [Ferranicluibacter rubi]
MGLDVTAYSKLSKIDDVKYLDGDVYDKTLTVVAPEAYDLVVYVSRDFPGREEGLEDRGVYQAEESFGFRAGSYGGYNDFREELAKLAGYPSVPGDSERHNHSRGAWAAKGGLFWELIKFSDCDGTIGPVVSKKLSEDFRTFDADAQTHGDAWFYQRYQEWKKAFELAADDGAVSFQ